MGLDISRRTGNRVTDSMRFSSYSGVQEIRVFLCRASLLAARLSAVTAEGEDQHRYPDWPEEIDEVESWIGEKRPIYEMMSQSYADFMSRRWSVPLVGLWKLVNHSDCDGMHSPGDCADIAAMFARVDPFLDQVRDGQDHRSLIAHIRQLAAFFTAAAKAGEWIAYH